MITKPFLVDYVNYREQITQHRKQKIKKAMSICAVYDIEDLAQTALGNYALTRNPYHNAYHTACMIVNANEAISWYKMKFDDAQSLIIACLYHDINHTGGRQCDTANIAYACATVAELSLSNDLKEDVIKLIAMTEFPFIRTPVTVNEQIIRDCDLLQMLEVDWMDQIFSGLYTELKTKDTWSHLTPELLIELQLNFLEKAEFYSKWFFTEKADKWSAALEELRGLK